MKKRSLLMAASLVLALLVATTGTLAYLSDVDSDVNVMTLGNVKIEQIEMQRVVGKDGWVPTGETDKYGYTPDNMEPYVNAKPLYPVYAKDGIIWDNRVAGHQQSWGQVGAPGSSFLFDDSVVGAQDKFVFVKNTGSSDAYVRTWFALEQGSVSGDDFESIIRTNGDSDHWSWETIATDVEISGNKYVVAVATYLGPKSNPSGILAAGEVSYPSLLQVYMTAEAENEDVAAIDGNGNGLYEILVYSQAVQTTNFPDAETALNAAFGEPTAKNAPWLEDTTGLPVSTVATADELTKAVAEGGTIMLTADIDMVSATLTVNKETTIDLAGHTLIGTATNGQGCLIMVNNAGTLNIEDTSADQSGKITYTNTSKIGWTIDVEGQLNLYSGTIELTGEDWSIGYCVDVRPNAWGSKYANATVFHMYGGKLVSSDGAIRVASSSADSYADISAAFIMDGGEIEAKWDGVFIQQSNAAYDTLTVELNGGKITSDLAPVRFYGPDAASVNSGAAKPMKLVLGGTELVPAEVDASRNYYPGYDGVIVYGGGMSLDNLNQYTTIVK